MMEIARESQIMEYQFMCCVSCACVPGLHICMNSPHLTCFHTQRMHRNIDAHMHQCTGVFTLAVGPCVHHG